MMESDVRAPGALAKPYALFLLVATVVSIGSFLMVEFSDSDIWWHLAIGKDIMHRWAIPVTDRYSVAGFGHAYHDSHWLFQVLAAGVEACAGLRGITVLMAVLWGGTLFCTYRALRQWVAPATASLLLFLVAMASMERFIPRPELVTFFMIAFFWLRLQQGRFRSVVDLAILAAAQVVWANSHGLFVFGPAMAGCYAVVEAVRRVRRQPSEVAYAVVLVIVLTAATLLNPYGIRSWEYAFLLFTEVGPSAPSVLKKVGELSPTFGQATRSAPPFWFFLTLVIMAGGATVYGAVKKNLSPSRLLIAAVMLAAALSGRRNMVLFALVAAPLVAELCRSLLVERDEKWRRAIAVVSGLAMLGLAFVPVRETTRLTGKGRHLELTIVSPRIGLGPTPSYYPHRFPDFMKHVQFAGNIFNSSNIGGFILYHFYPDRLPLTDGRWEVYGSATMSLLENALNDQRAFQEVVDRYNIGALLLEHYSPEAKRLLPRLAGNPAWQVCYYDYAASFWVRRDRVGTIPPADLSPAALLAEPGRVDDCMLLDLFLATTGSPELRLRNLLRGVQFGSNRTFFLERIGILQMNGGRAAEAERTLSDLLRLDPDNAVALNGLSNIAYSKGDLETAARILQHAIEVYPANETFRQNYLAVTNAMRR